MKSLALVAAGLAFAMQAAQAAPVTYDIDPSHTYPSFEADHMGGLSTWRGKFNRSSGVNSVDFGHDEMNKHAVAPDIFDARKYPTATFKGGLRNLTATSRRRRGASSRCAASRAP